MFNIWKQAWRNGDTTPGSGHEASVNLEIQSGATSDQLFAGSASVPLSASVIPQIVFSRA